MNIEVAGKSDIEELTAVEIESKRQSIPGYIDAVEIDYALRLHRWRTYFNKESPKSSKPERVILKAVIDSHIAGYIAGHLTNRYEMDAEIQSFYILINYQRNGIGKSLLMKFVEWLNGHQAKRLCVGIAKGNKYQAFYLKFGGKHLNEHWIYWDDLNVLQKILFTPR